MMLNIIRNGLPRRFAPRNDGKHTSDSKSLSLRTIQSRGNPFLILITILALCFSPCQAAIKLDGINDHIKIESMSISAPLTFSFWVNLKSYSSSFPSLISSASGNLTIGTTATQSFYAAGLYFTASPIPLNVWVYRTYIISGGNISLYNNATFVESRPFGVTNFNEFTLGCYHTLAYFSNAEIDDVRIYNRPLITAEIESLYHSRSKRPSGSLANGLVAHYEMDDDQIGAVAAQAKDSSGNLNHGQFIGFDNLTTALSNDVPAQIGTGYSLEFDGVDDYIDTVDDGPSNGVGPFHFDDSQNWSITIWYKGSDNETNLNYGKTLLGRDNGDFWANLVLRNGRVEYTHYDGSWQHNIISNNNVADNQWHFISYVNHSNATGDLYIDSNPDIAGASSVFNDPSRRFVINSIMRGYNNKFTNGLIDGIRIYNRTLTPSEISFLYNGSGLDPGTSNLQALWTFDDSALKDSSGNDNHGLGFGGDSLRYSEGVLRR